MVSETKNKLNKLFISTFIEWIARLSIERFRFIFWQYERPTNWHQFLARRLYDHDHDGPCIRFGNFHLNRRISFAQVLNIYRITVDQLIKWHLCNLIVSLLRKLHAISLMFDKSLLSCHCLTFWLFWSVTSCLWKFPKRIQGPSWSWSYRRRARNWCQFVGRSYPFWKFSKTWRDWPK
jgi:hypothetical protein